MNMNRINIKKIIRESIEAFLLNENKTVTFGGKTNPNFGWAVFICGAPGSGKSTAAKQHIPIDGKVFTPDHFREAYAYLLNKRNFKDGDTELTYDLSTNSGNKAINDMPGIADNGFFNKQLNNVKNSIKKKSDWKPTSNSKLLPNLIFDTTGTKLDSLNKAFNMLKELGDYKVSVIWVVSNRDVAFVNNAARERVINVNQFHKGHNAVMGSEQHKNLNSIQDFLNSFSNDIDEAWMIINSSFDEVDGVKIQRRPNEIENQSNVVKLEKVGDSFKIPEILGTDDKKPFLGGKKNVSLRDIVGDEVKFSGRGQFMRPSGYPSVGDVKKNAKKDKTNHFGLPNTAVKFDQDAINKRKQDELERFRFSKLSPEEKKKYLEKNPNINKGMRHSSMM